MFLVIIFIIRIHFVVTVEKKLISLFKYCNLVVKKNKKFNWIYYRNLKLLFYIILKSELILCMLCKLHSTLFYKIILIISILFLRKV